MMKTKEMKKKKTDLIVYNSESANIKSLSVDLFISQFCYGLRFLFWRGVLADLIVGIS